MTWADPWPWLLLVATIAAVVIPVCWWVDRLEQKAAARRRRPTGKHRGQR